MLDIDVTDERVTFTEPVTDAEDLPVLVALDDAVVDLVPTTLFDGEAVAVCVGDADGDNDDVGVTEAVGVVEADRVWKLAVCDLLPTAVRDKDEVTLGEEDTRALRVGDDDADVDFDIELELLALELTELETL